jgi:[ribosomal protein S5]-alanine N-acetyltransferase
MEMMPFHHGAKLGGPSFDQPALPTWGPFTGMDWRTALPVLQDARLTLRDLALADAPALFAHLTTEEVARFISPPPTSVAGFEQFIRWAQRERAAGLYACFAVVPTGETEAVGLFQIRVLNADQGIAEWGFALGAAYWGTGLFFAAAQLVVDFAFEQMSVRRLEARAAIPNGRGNGALRKLGAVREAVLRQTFVRHGERLDQALWAILRETWWLARTVVGGTVH